MHDLFLNRKNAYLWKWESEREAPIYIIRISSHIWQISIKNKETLSMKNLFISLKFASIKSIIIWVIQIQSNKRGGAKYIHIYIHMKRAKEKSLVFWFGFFLWISFFSLCSIGSLTICIVDCYDIHWALI